MKNNMTNIFAKLALVVGLAIAFEGVARGADEKITITINSFTGLPSGNASYDTYNWSQGGIAGKATIYANQSSTSMQFNASNYLFYSTSAISGTIKSIKLTTASGTNRTYVVYGSTSAYSGSGTSYGTQIGSQTVTTSGTTYTVSSGNYTYFTIVKSGSGAGYLSSVEVTYTPSGGSSTASATTTTIRADGITNTDIYKGIAAGFLFASVTAGGNPIDGASVTWSGNNDAVATIDASSGAVTLVAAGTVTFTASYAGDSGTYQASSDTYEMTVTDSTPFSGGDVEFDATKESGTSPLLKNGVSFTCSNGVLNNGSEYRLYKNSTTTFSVTSGVITSIAFTGVSSYPASGFASQEGWTTSGNNGTWTGSSKSVSFTASGAQVRATKIVVTVSLNSSKSNSDLTITNESTDLAFDLYNNSTAQVINYTTSSTGAITISPASPTTYFSYEHNASNKTITVTPLAVTPSEQTITISQAEDESYNSGSVSFTVSVTNSDPNVPGSVFSPYTVADARDAIDANTGITDVYVHGIVSKVDSYNSTYKSITYWISDDGTTTDQLEVYSGKGINGADFSSVNDILVGDVVTVKGTLKKYNGVYEFDYNNQLVSLVRKPAAPTFSPAAGAVIAGTEVTISTTTDGATIYYTTDGNEPTTSSTEYTEPITVSAAMTIKAIAVKDAVSSDVANAAYTIAQPVATPTFSPDGGTYTSVQSVEISCKTEDATIYYTTNGDTPTTSSTEYTSAISVNENMTIKAIAVKDGMANSSVAEAAYTINIPSIAANDVTIAYDATSGEIAYTINNPTEATLTATCSEEWISNITVSSEKVSFTTTANEGDADRTATFTLSYTGAVDKTVTVTQEHLVVDYATLPFNWTGGSSSDLKALTGVTTSTLSDDYASGNSPYLVKFDADGKYIQIKTDSRPSTVTVGVKMIGGGNTSTLKIQGSSDGTNFSDVESLTISGSQNAILNLSTKNSFAETDRYVRLYFNKGSNVGIGPISIAKYVEPSSDPSITVTPNTASPAASDVSESLTLTYENLEISDASDFAVQFCDAQGAALTAGDEPSWIVADVEEQNSGYVVSIVMNANEGAERSAYFKVYALGNTDYVYSNLVTITQAEYVADYAGLPFTWNSEFGTAPTGIAINGSTANKTSYLNITGTGAAVILKINEAPGTLTFDIRGNSFSGGTFKVQTSANGVSYTDLATYTELGTVQSEEFSNFTTNVRYIKWVYTEKVNGNVGIGNISLTKAEAAPDNINLAATSNGNGYWVSFYNGAGRYDLPDGAQAFTLDSEYKLYRLGDGKVIPQGVAVIIIADKANITLKKSDKTGVVAVSGKDNESILLGSDSPIAKESGKLYYVLGIKDNIVGFYKYNGAKLPAGKAYYTVNVSE